MKNKILGIVVPALAAVAVIGTGFATWQFTENGASASIGATLEGYTNLGDITIKNAEYATLNLDSSTTGDGITLECSSGAGATDDQIDFEFEVKQDLAREKSLELTTTISFASDLGSYIKLSAQNYRDESELGDEKSADNMSTSLSWEDTLTTSDSKTEETFSLSTHLSFSWAEGMEPDTLRDWNTLRVIINNLSDGTAFTISYEIDYAA